MKFNSIQVTVLLFCFLLGSCGSNQEKLIGTWEFSSINPELTGEAQSKEFKVRQMRKELKGEQFIFNEGGKGAHLLNGISNQFTYVLNSANELRIDDTDQIFKITTLTEKKMCMYYDLQNDGGIRLTYLKQEGKGDELRLN